MTRRAGSTGSRSRAAVALAIVVLAALTLLVRLPAALSDLSQQARRNDAFTPHDRVLATADSLAIDNGIVDEALRAVPDRSTFALLAPNDAEAARQGVASVTLHALPGFFRELLLPAREVSAARARYFICYGCNAERWSSRVRWTWRGTNGHLFGVAKDTS